MNKEALKEYLEDNIEYVEAILEDCGFCNIKYYESSKQWRMGECDYSNPSSIRLSSKDLSYKDYKYNTKGDIFSLVMSKKHYNFYNTLNYIAKLSNYEDVEVENSITLPYKGFFKQYKPEFSNEIKVYPTSELERYKKTVSTLFLRDNISIETQEKFDIRYCNEQHRVVIPCYSDKGLIGAIGRFNKKYINDLTPKYLPILTYNKSQYVFGINENYNNIINNTVYIVESEKTVLECDSIGINNVVAIGGNSISETHRQLILRCQPAEVIIILDKGLGIDRAKKLNVIDIQSFIKQIIVDEAKKMINPFSKVGYLNCNDIESIKDKENIFTSGIEYDIIMEIIKNKKVEIFNGK
jgi:hypothetical protein